MITVTLPGITPLTNAMDSGSLPYLVSIAGWYDGVESEFAGEELSTGDGSFDDDPVRLRSRSFAVEGAVVTIDPVAVFTLHRQVMGLQSLGAFSLPVTDPEGTQSSMVRLDGKPSFTIDREDGVARFSVPLRAPDPVKYGPLVTQSIDLPTPGGGMVFNAPASSNGNFDFGAAGKLGRISLTNVGDAAVWPMFTVLGYLELGFFLNCLETGQILRYDRVVPSGSTVSIDPKSGAVLIDSLSDGSTYLTSWDFFNVPPGQTRTVQFNTTGSSDAGALLTISLANGFR